MPRLRPRVYVVGSKEPVITVDVEHYDHAVITVMNRTGATITTKGSVESAVLFGGIPLLWLSIQDDGTPKQWYWDYRMFGRRHPDVPAPPKVTTPGKKIDLGFSYERGQWVLMAWIEC